MDYKVRKRINKVGKIFRIFVFIFFLYYNFSFSWPTDSQWFPVLKNGEYLQDPIRDATGSRDVVSGPNHPAAFIYNDGTYIYFRLRLNQSPEGTGGQGYLQPYGWGLLIDTNLNYANYEWMIMVNGISQNEKIDLWQNTVQGQIGSPADAPEILAYSLPLAGNFRILPADTSFDGNLDYFIDFRFPYSIFKQITGLTDYSPIRFFFGTSNSTNTLTADLVGGSDLYTGFSDYVTPFGKRPTTGIIRFVADIHGNGDKTQECIGNTLFIRVDDDDQNYNPTAINTVQVTLTILSGDTETITLYETGVNTGIFTGSIYLTYGNFIHGDGIFQASVGSIITATYIDFIDANLNLNQPRTDTLIVCGPIINVSKIVNPSSVASGGLVTYTITISNTGTGTANITKIEDVLPSNFSYINNSTSGLTTNNPSINGQILSWIGNFYILPGESKNLIFQANASNVSGYYYNNVSVFGTNFPTFFTGNTAPVSIGAPLITLSKTVDKNYANPGEEVIYTIHYKNNGSGVANFLIITDTIPPNTHYVPNSLKIGDVNSNYNTATSLTDQMDSDQGHISGNNIIFQINTINPDEEGKVYFKVKIN